MYHVIQSSTLNIDHSPVHLSHSFHVSFVAWSQLQRLVSVAAEAVPFIYPLPEVVAATDAMPSHLAFYLQGSGVSISCCGTWCGSVCRVHITLQELQAIALMLCKMVFQLSGKVVVLHLDNFIAKVYLCNQGGTAQYCSLFQHTYIHRYIPITML